MNKKARIALWIFIIFALIALFLIMNFVFSVHTSSPSSISINTSQNNYFFNITVNNTDAAPGNITQINITLPTGFSFTYNTNGTNIVGVGNIFTNTSATNLSWTNTTSFLSNKTIYNVSYFWFNATTPSTPGLYNISILSLNGTGNYQTNLTVRVTDIVAPVITLISPTNGSSSIAPNSNVAFTFNVSDSSSLGTTNCSLFLNGNLINFNSSVNTAIGNTTIFTNLSGYIISNTWNVTCTDSDNNIGNSSIYTFSLVSFQFNGTTKDENGTILNNSVINITIRNPQGWSPLAYTSGTSNASGWFNFSIPSNSSWQYEPSLIHKNGTVADFKGKTIPAFPSQMLNMLAGAIFYLTPAGTMNITAINQSGGRTVFQYQVKDTKLGYPIAEDHTNWNTEVNVYVPRNRNYSIMIYPNNSMPVSFNWNNFSSTTTYNLTGSAYNPTTNRSWYDVTTYTLHKQFNLTMTMAMVSGYVTNASGYPMNASSFLTWTNFTVIPYLIEPGNMVHSEYGDMPYNLSTMYGTPQTSSDQFTLATGFFNLSIPAPVETSNILLFAALQNGTIYYGGFKNISLPYGMTANTTNITIYGMLGSAGNITMDRIDGGGNNIAIPTAKQTFNIVNTTNSSLSQTQAHVETTVDYSAYGALQFTWMSDVQQSQSTAFFSLPLLNITGVKEINVFVSGGPSEGSGGRGQQYAPKRVSTMTAAEITANFNITMRTFNPGDIDGSLGASSITIALYVSNSSCDVPNPVSSCLLGNSSTMEEFHPMQAVMGGGKISFRMGYSNILVHYVNVDMMASGPPDALFDSSTNTTGTSGSSFASALRFGSQGPTIYDYILASIPYTETAGSGLNDSADVNISIPKFYDDNWNVIWDTANNGTVSALAGNFSHYSTYQADWGNLTTSKTCITVNVTASAQINSTNPCYIDNSSNKIWIRLPHFSGTGPSVTGSVMASPPGTTTPSSGGGTGASTQFWTSTQQLTNEQFTAGYIKELAAKNRLSFTIGTTTHYVGVISLTSTTATINVSSSPQQAVFNIGDEKKFEVTNDSYYDVSVKLNSIANNKANITIKSIHEVVPAVTTPTTTPPTTEPTTPTAPTAGEEEKIPTLTKTTWVVIIGVIIAVIIIILIYYSYKKRH